MLQIGIRGSQNNTTNAAQIPPHELRKIARGETNHRRRDQRRARLALKHRGLSVDTPEG